MLLLDELAADAAVRFSAQRIIDAPRHSKDLLIQFFNHESAILLAAGGSVLTRDGLPAKVRKKAAVARKIAKAADWKD